MQKIAILYDASQAVLSTFDLDEVFEQILAIMRDYFHLETGAILLLDEKRQELRVRAYFGPQKLSGERVPVGTGIVGMAASKKLPIHVPDVTQDPRYVPLIASTRSELAVPLMLRDEVVGVLDCQSNQLDCFDSETLDLLTLFSTQASLALQNARLYSLEQRRAAQLEAINAIARQTHALLDLKQLLGRVCSLVLQSFPVDHVSVLLLEGGQLVQRAECGRLTPRFAAGDTVPLEAGLCARAVQSAKPALDNDVAKLPGYVAAFEETQSEMCLPLVSGGQILGVLALESGSAGAFEAADVQPLESVADICATAIQNVNYVERLRHLAYVDALTGIFNRRFFERRIQEEIDRARRGRRSLAVLMADIDQFKKLNDEFGHLVGDEVLRQVSAALSATLRKADVVCRYGGEEFAILLPETGGENALAVAEKVRRHLETQVFTGVPRPVTISIGVADYPDHGTTRDALVQSADCGLYAAKEAGRNCVRPCADIPTSAKTVQGGDPGSGALNALGGGASG